MFAVRPHVVECTGRRIWIRESGNTRSAKNALTFSHGFSAHPARQKRLVLLMGVRRKEFGDFSGICHSLWRQGDDKTVARGIVNRNLERLCITFRIGVTEDIDRVRVTPVKGEKCVQRSLRVSRKRSKLPAVRNQGVRREDAWAACIGKNCKARTARPWLLTKDLGHVEQIRDVLDAKNTAAPKSCVKDFVAACERAGVGRSCFGSCFSAARLDENDRFAQGNFSRGGQK